MLKFIAPVVLGGLGLLFSASNAFAAGGCGGCAAVAPPCAMPMAPEGHEGMQMSQATRTVRSYSYEPGVRTYSYEPAASYRSSGRSYSRPAAGGLRDATAKARGNY